MCIASLSVVQASTHRDVWKPRDGGLHAAEMRAVTDSSAKTSESPFHDVVEIVEEILVSEALTFTSGNQVKATELLGLNRATLRKKMRRYLLKS